jgi:hypothetical protein
VDSELIQVFATNAGFAGVVIVAIIMGLLYPRTYVKDLKEENARLRESLALERARADAAVQATNTTNQILGAIHDFASERAARPDHAAGEIRSTLQGTVYED